MKKFVKKLGIYFLLLLLISIVPAYLIDPYNVFHAEHPRDNGCEMNGNYVKMTYILNNPDKFDSFLFGSSRASAIPADMLHGKAYRLNYSGGLPSENVANLQTLIKNGIVPKYVYVELDMGSYNFTIKEHENDPMRASYEFSKTNPGAFWKNYLDPAINFNAWMTVIKDYLPSSENYAEEYQETGLTTGYANYDEDSADLAQDKADNAVSEDVKESYRDMQEALKSDEYKDRMLYMDECMEAVQKFVDVCGENGIELCVFVTATSYIDFSYAVSYSNYLTFLRRLADITPYYNFSGFNKYTTDLTLYAADASHPIPYLGEIIADSMINGNTDEDAYSQGFGWYVDKGNVEDLISLLTGTPFWEKQG